MYSFFSSPTGFLFLPGPPVRSCYRVAEGGVLSPPPVLSGPCQEDFLKDLAAGPLLISGLQMWQERPWSWCFHWLLLQESFCLFFQSSPRSPLCHSLLIQPTHILSPLSSSSLPCSSPFLPPFIFLAYLGAQSKCLCLRRPRPPQTGSMPSQLRLTLRPPPHGTF